MKKEVNEELLEQVDGGLCVGNIVKDCVNAIKDTVKIEMEGVNPIKDKEFPYAAYQKDEQAEIKIAKEGILLSQNDTRMI